MKRVILLSLLMLLLTAGAVSAAPMVVLDGEAVSFGDVSPVMDNGRVLVPMRTIFEALECDVIWDRVTQTVIARKKGLEIQLVIGGEAYKNGEQVSLDVPAKLVNGRTMVPLRFVSEALGCVVAWDGETQKATIERPPQNLIITDETFFESESSGSEVRLSATVENPNSRYIPYQLKYKFIAYDGNDRKIAETGSNQDRQGDPRSTIFLIPPGQKVTMHSSLYTNELIARVRLKIEPFEWRRFTGEIPAMTVSDTKLEYEDRDDDEDNVEYIKITGQVTNEAEYFRTGAWVQVTLTGADGKPVDGRCVVVENIGPKQKQPFEAYFKNKWGSTKYTVTALPMTIKQFDNSYPIAQAD